MADQFKKGDVVRLKSGGPAMTVTTVADAAYGGGQMVWVTWFDDNNKPANGNYPPEALELED